MKQILAVSCLTVLALIVINTYQVVKAPSGLTVVSAGSALGADMRPPPRPPPPPPPPAPVGKGKAPIGYGKGKAPPPVVTNGYVAELDFGLKDSALPTGGLPKRLVTQDQSPHPHRLARPALRALHCPPRC